MKKIFSIIFLLIIGILIYSGIQLSKVFTSEIPKVDENLQVVKQKEKTSKENIKKEKSKNEQSQNDEVKKNVESVTTKTNTQNQKTYNQIKKETNQNIKTESPNEDVKQESVQNQPVQQTQTVQPQVQQPKEQPVEQITQSPRYETYQGSYTSWEECKEESINVAFETDARTMCYEEYIDSNGQPVYKIQIVY